MSIQTDYHNGQATASVTRYYREPAIVLISQVDDDTYLVIDGQTEYYIDQETFENEYKEL